MSKISYLQIIGFAALYVVTVFLTAFLGFLAPWTWVFFPLVAALFGALSYYCTAIRWKKFGVGTVLAVALAAFLLAVGECDLSKALLIMLAGVISDVVRQIIGHTILRGQLLAYPILSIGVIGWILPLWTRTEWYYQGATEEIGVDYANGLMMFANPLWLAAVVLTTAVAGFAGILFASKVFKPR